MRLQRFPAGVKPLESDLNSLSDNSLEGIQDLISVFSGASSGSVLFDAAPPITSVDLVNGDDFLTVTTASQRVSIGGAVETSADYFETFDVSSTDRYVEIFFIISRAPVTATRNFLSLDTDSGSTILQNLEAEIAEITNVRVVYQTQASLPGTPNDLEPVLNANDLGFARLGSVSYDQSAGTTVFTPDDSFKFQFPIPPDITIPETGPVTGSESGLMTPALLAKLETAVQVVANDPDTPYLSFAATSISGAPGYSASIQTGEGLTVTQSQGLAPDFRPPSAANGQTTKVARADHVHALSQSGIVRVVKQFSLQSSLFGQLQTVSITSSDLPQNVTLSEIMNVELMWQPSQASEGRIDLGWTNLSGGGTVGARAYITDTSNLSIEIGSLGVVELLSPAARELVEGWTNGVSVDTYPSTGSIYVSILGLRDGANG